MQVLTPATSTPPEMFCRRYHRRRRMLAKVYRNSTNRTSRAMADRLAEAWHMHKGKTP